MNNVTFDRDTFKAYCKKYRMRNALRILALFDAAKPTLQLLPKQYSWQTDQEYGFIFEGEGKTFIIQMDNYRKHKMTNVTFVGIDGINWTKR